MRQKALVYGYGNTYLKNIYWIRQLYETVGVTDARIVESCEDKKEYTVEDAVKLDYEIILVASAFFDEIKDRLTNGFNIDASKICWFQDEFSKERHESFGEKNLDVTFYVFRAHWQECKNGFYNFFDRVFAAYYEVKRQGFELLVDMKNYYTEYAGIERYGTVNIWEDYYKQPSSYTLEEAYQSKNVILSKFDDRKYNMPMLTDIGKRYLSNLWWVETYKMLAKMFVITPNRVLKGHIVEEIERFTMLEGALGVLARGTDYVSLKPKNHPIPCDTELLIDKCKKRLSSGLYKYVYIATEDLDILEAFKKAFGERLLFTEQERVNQNVKKALMDIKFPRNDDGYLRGLEYCTVIEVLARCRGLLANCCCYGALGAIAANGGRYIECDVLDAGKYD